MGDSVKDSVAFGIDPANTLGFQDKGGSSSKYEMQLPAFLRTDPSIQEPFYSPAYRESLSKYYGGREFPSIQQNIRNWLLSTTPLIKTKVKPVTPLASTLIQPKPTLY